MRVDATQSTCINGPPLGLQPSLLECPPRQKSDLAGVLGQFLPEQDLRIAQDDFGHTLDVQRTPVVAFDVDAKACVCEHTSDRVTAVGQAYGAWVKDRTTRHPRCSIRRCRQAPILRAAAVEVCKRQSTEPAPGQELIATARRLDAGQPQMFRSRKPVPLFSMRIAKKSRYPVAPESCGLRHANSWE